MWAFLLVIACVKEVPPHLRVETTPKTTSEATLSGLVSTDPLLRRPDPRTEGSWSALPEADAIEIWAKVARKTRPLASDWRTSEADSRGTIGAALSKGAMLAALEASMGDWSHPNQQEVAEWLGLTETAARPATRDLSEPLAWLPGVTPKEKYEAARHIASRAVLSAWLDGPNMDLRPAGSALELPLHTGIADTPTGQLIRARASGARNPDAAQQGLSDLWEATRHALRWVGADGNRAQKELLKERQAFREQHGTNPVAHYLRLAQKKLITNAYEPDSSGLAWIAINAERLEGTCPDTPCDGLDKTSNIKRAAVWGPTAKALSTIWQLIAIKSALDTFETSLDKPLLYKRLPQIVDAFAGSHDSRIPLPVLRYRKAERPLILNLSSLINADPTLDSEHLFQSIHQRIHALCDAAIDLNPPPAIAKELSVLRRNNAKQMDH